MTRSFSYWKLTNYLYIYIYIYKEREREIKITLRRKINRWKALLLKNTQKFKSTFFYVRRHLIKLWRLSADKMIHRGSITIFFFKYSNKKPTWVCTYILQNNQHVIHRVMNGQNGFILYYIASYESYMKNYIIIMENKIVTKLKIRKSVLVTKVKKGNRAGGWNKKKATDKKLTAVFHAKILNGKLNNLIYFKNSIITLTDKYEK